MYNSAMKIPYSPQYITTIMTQHPYKKIRDGRRKSNESQARVPEKGRDALSIHKCNNMYATIKIESTVFHRTNQNCEIMCFIKYTLSIKSNSR